MQMVVSGEFFSLSLTNVDMMYSFFSARTQPRMFRFENQLCSKSCFIVRRCGAREIKNVLSSALSVGCVSGCWYYITHKSISTFLCMIKLKQNKVVQVAFPLEIE